MRENSDYLAISKYKITVLKCRLLADFLCGEVIVQLLLPHTGGGMLGEPKNGHDFHCFIELDVCSFPEQQLVIEASPKNVWRMLRRRLYFKQDTNTYHISLYKVWWWASVLCAWTIRCCTNRNGYFCFALETKQYFRWLSSFKYAPANVVFKSKLWEYRYLLLFAFLSTFFLLFLKKMCFTNKNVEMKLLTKQCLGLIT